MLTHTVTDTTIADHGNPSTVGSFAWVVATINALNPSAVRQASITFGPGTFLFGTRTFIHNDIAIQGQGPDITKLEMSNTGGIYFRRGEVYAVNSNVVVGQQFIPSAAYGPLPNDVAFRCIVAGVTHATAEPVWPITVGATVASGTAVFETVDSPNWEFKNLAANMATNMTGAAFSVFACNSGSLDNLKIAGGNSTNPNNGIVVDSCNQVYLGRLNFAAIRSNGLLINMSNIVTFPYNFGDGMSTSIDIAFTGSRNYGICILGDSTSTRYVNDIVFTRVKISGMATPANVHIPIFLRQAKRIKFVGLNIDSCTYGIVEIADNSNIGEFNGVDGYSFLPASAQAAEASAYCRGIPLAAAAVTPYKAFVVRNEWFDIAPFSAWSNSQGTFMIQDEGGSYSRALTSANAIQRNTPAGFATITLAGTVPTEMRDTISRRPCIHNTSNFPVGFYAKHLSGNLADKGATIAPGVKFRFGTTSAFNYQGLSAVLTAADTVSVRFISYTLDGFKIKCPAGGAVVLDSEIATGSVQINKFKFEEFTVATLPAASSRTGQYVSVIDDVTGGLIARSNGTNWVRWNGSGNAVVA